MNVNVIVGRTPTHIIKTVRCNEQEYSVPFPSTPHSFINIIQNIQIPKEYEKTLIVLSRKQNHLNSIQQFYKVQEQCQQYFDAPLEIDYLSFALHLLSQTDIALKELDKLQFKDLLSVFKHGFDSLARKMHPKLDRRIKKYLAETQRPSFEKEQIQRFIHVVKAQSTDEDVGQYKDQAQGTILDKSEGSGKKVEQPPKEFLSEQEKVEVSEQKPQKYVKQHKKHEGHHHVNNRKRSHDEEADWQDVEDEKLMKKIEKRQKKKQIIQQGQARSLQSEQNGDQRRNNVRERKEVRDRNIFASYKEKQDRDMRVQLGIIGDSDEGWRERYRVPRVPTN